MLGESHYGDQTCDYAEFTQDVVNRWGLCGRDRYFIQVAKLVLGVPAGTYLADEPRRAFWESVAFYNYVPGLVGPTPRVRPSPDQWEAAVALFDTVLAQLKPHAVVVLGAELWRHLTGLGPIAAHPSLRRLPLPTGGSAVATMTLHPSAFRFRLDLWLPRIREMLSAAGYPGGLQLIRAES